MLYNNDVVLCRHVLFGTKIAVKGMVKEMKNSAIKMVLCLILCIPVVAAVFAAVEITKYGAGNVPAHGRTLVVKYEDTVQAETSDNENLSVYDSVLENATGISGARNDLEQSTPYKVEITEADGATKTYDFYMSGNVHNCVFSDSEGNFFGITPSDAERLLQRTEFAYVYAAGTLPSATFACDVEVNGAVQSRSSALKANKYNWNVMTSSGDIKQCTYDGTSSSTNFIKMSAGGTYSFSFSEQPDSVIIKLADGEKTLFSGSPEEFSESAFARDNDTEYTLDITASYLQNDSREYSGDVTFSATALYDVPTSYKSQDSSVAVGEFTIIEIENANPGETFSVSGDMYLADDIRVQENNGKFFAIIPADFKCTANSESEMSFTSSEWGLTKISLPIRDKNSFEIYDGINRSSAALNFTDAAKNQYLDAVRSVLPNSERHKYWTNDDDFVAPCKGDYSNFGRILIMNDEESVNNIGIDIYAEEGTSVSPTHSGKVVFAGELSLTGSTVIIDHGFDVFSYYFHLGSIDCAVGDTVTKNSVIGTVGSTGFLIEDTSYMLFAVSVGSTYTNPVSVFKWGIKIPE